MDFLDCAGRLPDCHSVGSHTELCTPTIAYCLSTTILSSDGKETGLRYSLLRRDIVPF